MHRSVIILFLALCCCFFAQAQRSKDIVHKVRWMENIYTISKKYNANPNAILEYNQISANEIRRGIILRIPIDIQETTNQNLDSLNRLDPNNSIIPENLYLSDCMEHRPSSWTTHRASMILPFHLQDARPNSNYLDFYQGVLMAVWDLKEEGMSIELTSYDLESFPHIPAWVQSGALKNEELVIGPVSANDLFEVLNYTYGQNIKVISPLDSQTESAADTNPNFFQVNTPLYWQQYNLIQHLRKYSGTVWLFCEESGADQELVNVIKDILSKNHIIYKEFIHKVTKGVDIRGELSQMLTHRQNNQVIVASTNEAFVSDVLSNLYLVQTRNDCPVTLYGNARWRNFDVDLEYYHNMNLHLSTTNYIDYQDPIVKRFIERYRSLYRTEPTPYAYQGYDVGFYFLNALYTKGFHFEYCVEQGAIPARPLQSVFQFQKVSPDGGFINIGSRVIRYLPDFRIEILH